MDTTWTNTMVNDRTLSNISLGWLPIFAVLLSLAAPDASAQVAQQNSLAVASSGRSSSTASSVAASGRGVGPIIVPSDFSSLRAEPGDLLRVTVFDAPELSDTYRVDPSGKLTLPLCGEVKVEGLTSPAIARALATMLEKGEILLRAQVEVDLEQYAGRYVTVLGEVNNPGRVTVIAPTQLSDVLAQAGGLTAVAGAHVTIHKNGGETATEGDAVYSRSAGNRETESMLVGPGDVVLVPRAGVVYVLGAVYHPGGYIMQEDGRLNVAEALAMSGGTLLTARTNGLRVIRRQGDGAVLDFELSYDGLTRGSQAPLELMAQDIVYVPMSKIKATLMDTTALISTAISSAIYSTR